METAHNDREACWNEMLERWNELSWCAHAFHETDMIAAKILLWRDVTCEPALVGGGGESSILEQQAGGTQPHTYDGPRRSSILPVGLRVMQVGGRAVWWTLLGAAAAVGRALR